MEQPSTKEDSAQQSDSAPEQAPSTEVNVNVDAKPTTEDS